MNRFLLFVFGLLGLCALVSGDLSCHEEQPSMHDLLSRIEARVRSKGSDCCSNNELEVVKKIRFLLGKQRAASRYGNHHVPAWSGGMKCVRVNFDKPFPGADAPKIRVQASTTHRSYKGTGTHDASIMHLEGIDAKGFVACVAETKHHGKGAHDNNLFIEYFATTDKRQGNALKSGRISQGSWKGQFCRNQVFKTAFPRGSNVRVQATLNHYGQGSRHDSTTLWLERITTKDFRWCMREGAKHDGPHAPVKIDWIATAKTAHQSASGKKRMGGSVHVPAWSRGTKCVWVDFKNTFNRVPSSVFATINHRKYLPNGAHDSVTIWGENVQKNRARFCVRELHHHGAGAHDNNLFIDFVALE